MSNKFIIILLFNVFAASGQDTNLTYYQDIAPIIIENCASCHKENGYGPFELTTYKQVVKKGMFISHVVETKYMPPWRADSNFRHFKNERILSEEEINKIVEWVEQGMKKGKVTKMPPIPELNLNSDKPDLTLKMKQPYEISDAGIEDFRFFHVPTNLNEDVYIKSIEFIPGNKRLVHHSRVMSDTSNLIAAIDGLSEMDPKIKEFQKTPLFDEFLYGWVPGNLPVEFPLGTGKKLPANTDLLLNVHYAPSAEIKYDVSSVKIYFTDSEVKEEIKTLAIRENDIANQPFVIPANEEKRFFVSYVVSETMKIISVQPHMHYLGKSFTALAATPDGREIPLIKIDEWDFNWQTTYLLEEPLEIPGGSVILVSALFDNTSSNPANPNNPPIQVGYGWNSTDEMMNFIIYYY